MAVVVTTGPVTEVAEDHDIMIASALQSLNAAFNLYGIRMPSWARVQYCCHWWGGAHMAI